MKFRLVETLLTEGKNIERTWEQYKDKIQKFYDMFETVDDYIDNILSIDPTYVDGSNTTGDFGIWLTNMLLKGEFNRFEEYHELKSTVTPLLKEFIKKKPNLVKKDINQYKSIDELAQVLNDTDFSDRQKERQLRNQYKDAKKVFDGKDWEIWVPETYEASCTLGKGSGWCTADTRTRSYYDDYLEEHGGNYYIIINKHNPHDKYQFHWESNQFFASGTCPWCNTPDEEYQIDEEEFLLSNKEVGKFFDELGYWKAPINIDLSNIAFRDITLLSTEEAEQLPIQFREFEEWWWWLRSPGHPSNYAATVYYDCCVCFEGFRVNDDYGCVRPSLIVSNLNSLNLPIYSKVKLNGTSWRVISDNMLLCDDRSFGKHRFDNESNNYETSEIKQYIHEKAKELGLL